jgi:hypothetical protein
MLKNDVLAKINLVGDHCVKRAALSLKALVYEKFNGLIN